MKKVFSIIFYVIAALLLLVSIGSFLFAGMIYGADSTTSKELDDLYALKGQPGIRCAMIQYTYDTVKDDAGNKYRIFDAEDASGYEYIAVRYDEESDLEIIEEAHGSYYVENYWYDNYTVMDFNGYDDVKAYDISDFIGNDSRAWDKFGNALTGFGGFIFLVSGIAAVIIGAINLLVAVLLMKGYKKDKAFADGYRERNNINS